MPGPLAALWLVIVVIAAVVLWSVERGWIGRRSTSASGSGDDAVVTPVTATVAPAVLGYLVAAGDGQRCRCLDDAATATIADPAAAST